MSLAPHRRQPLVVACLCVCLSGAALLGIRAQVVPDTLPSELSDHEFWTLVTESSEPDGFFRSDNLVSNERTYQEVVPELKRRTLPNGVYLGVGPDQNFTYIAALHPRIAFIVDIRRGNMLQHLFYKALVEMASDRADFLARLFSRERPYGIDGLWTAGDLFDAYSEVVPSQELYQKNLADIKKWLTDRHGFTLTADDLRGIEYVASAFFAEGPDLRYSFPSPRLAPVFPTYSDLQIGIGREDGCEARTISGRCVTSSGGISSCPSLGTSPARRRCARSVGTSRRTAGRSITSTRRTSSSTCSRTTRTGVTTRTSRRCRWPRRARSSGRSSIAASTIRPASSRPISTRCSCSIRSKA